MNTTSQAVGTNWQREDLPGGERGALSRVLNAGVVLLVGAVWVSTALFGLYILAFYAGAVADGTPETWNEGLPRLYERETLAANIGIGLHFAAGGILLALGPIQLIRAVRRRLPALHRWLGRVYIFSALLAGLGGLAFIGAKGTIGGMPMNIGFGLYGALMVLAAVQAYRHARARRLDVHRAWAIRLFALAVGSWLYRMYYGFWMLLSGGAGHTANFDGWFDIIMVFFFYVPNLLVAEFFIRSQHRPGNIALRLGAIGGLAFGIGLVALGTYYFTRFSWGPAIVARLGF